MAFVSILDKTKRTGMITGPGGSFIFDIVTDEVHTSNLRVTENPVETGSNISDHAVLEPKEITITGIMVSYNRTPRIAPRFPGFDLSEYPLPEIDDPAFNNHMRNVRKNAALFDDASNSPANAVTQIAAEFLPNFQTPLADLSGGDRIQNALDNLLALQRSGEPVEVLTHSRLYKNMMITSITLEQNKASAGEFNIVLREIFIVESKIGSGLVVPNSNMPKQVSKVNLGNTQPKKVENGSSGLHDMFGS